MERKRILVSNSSGLNQISFRSNEWNLQMAFFAVIDKKYRITNAVVNMYCVETQMKLVLS